MMEILQEEWIDRVFIIGWQKIYEEFLKMKLIDEVWLSKIPGRFEGDAFFPIFEDDFREEEIQSFETFQFVKYKHFPSM